MQMLGADGHEMGNLQAVVSTHFFAGGGVVLT